MKKLIALLLMSVALLLVGQAALRPSIELFWEPAPTNEMVLAYRVYWKANLSDPNWTLLVTLPKTVTNQFLVPGDASRYYTLGSSNIWGESFAPAVWVPAPATSSGAFGIR